MERTVDIAKYLERINYQGSREPILPTLQALHEAHLLAVPFENLDIFLGRAIVLDEASLWTKIIEHHRGGFCYELNGLFALLLRALGFQVDLLSAAVARSTGGGTTPHDGGEFNIPSYPLDIPSRPCLPFPSRALPALHFKW